MSDLQSKFIIRIVLAFPSLYIGERNLSPFSFSGKEFTNLKDEKRIVEEILQTVGLEAIGPTKPRVSQLKNLNTGCELVQRRLPRKKEIKEAPLIKLGSHNA